MGEYADLSIDESFFMEDEFDDRDYGNSVDDCRQLNHDIKCKFCKKEGFHWRKTPNGWRLFNSEGMHFCKKVTNVQSKSSPSL